MHKHYAYRYDLEAQLIDRRYSNSALVFFFYAMSPFCWFCLLVLTRSQYNAFSIMALNSGYYC